MIPETRIGRLSELVESTPTPAVDWSHIRQDLAGLDPGELLSIRCPADYDMKKLRSTVLTYGRRIDKGDWRFSTRTDGNRLHVFLAEGKPRITGP